MKRKKATKKVIYYVIVTAIGILMISDPGKIYFGQLSKRMERLCKDYFWNLL